MAKGQNGEVAALGFAYCKQVERDKNNEVDRDDRPSHPLQMDVSDGFAIMQRNKNDLVPIGCGFSAV